MTSSTSPFGISLRLATPPAVKLMETGSPYGFRMDSAGSSHLPMITSEEGIVHQGIEVCFTQHVLHQQKCQVKSPFSLPLSFLFATAYPVVYQHNLGPSAIFMPYHNTFAPPALPPSTHLPILPTYRSQTIPSTNHEPIAARPSHPHHPALRHLQRRLHFAA